MSVKHQMTRRYSLITLLLGAFLACTSASAAEPAVIIPKPALDNAKAAGKLQTAVLAGGCFWGVQGVYQYTRGVKKVLSGYSGGDKASADYETVSSGQTGHAEAVQIVFDPKEISYGELLQIYFSVIHDPTQLNRQGPDVGTQYRSAIFYLNNQQKKIAQSYVKQLEKAKAFPQPIVTQLAAYKAFYPAESYHQDFLVNNPRHPYIVFHDLPKVRNLKEVFPQVYRDPPVTVAAATASR